MSLQWMAVAGFLYFEIALCLILMFPYISATRWQKVFRSRMLASLSAYANLYFNIFILILLLLFVDSIRDIYKYNEAESAGPDLSNNPMAESINHMKLFRAQRNFYIAGFALFLFVVLRKLVVMISAHAQLAADCEASKKQALSATVMAQALLDEKDTGDAKQNKKNEKQEISDKENELTYSQAKVDTLLKELETAKSDMQTMKKQAQATNTEYDRLLAEHAALQKLFDEGSKKDD